MSDLISLEQRRAEAEQTVRRFVRRFEPSYHALACHAALPLVLTPELLNYLRNEFLRNEEVPWVAEVDLLLSDLCRPVGYELYAMDTDVRAYLLAELERHFGRARIQQVAKLLISYVRYLAETGVSINEKELEAQQWAAMVYMDENHCQTAIHQIVGKFRSGGAEANQIGEGLVKPSEFVRLAQIITELASQLTNYPTLLDYAALVSEVMLGDSTVEISYARCTYEVLPGHNLILPEQLVREIQYRSQLTLESINLSINSPLLSTIEFTTGKFFEQSLVDAFINSVQNLYYSNGRPKAKLIHYLNKFNLSLDEIEEIAHEAMTRGIFRIQKSGGPIDQPENWIRRTCFLIAAQMQRDGARKRNDEQPLLSELLFSNKSNSLQELELLEQIELLKFLLQNLTEEDRILVESKFIYGMSYKQIQDSYVYDDKERPSIPTLRKKVDSIIKRLRKSFALNY